MTYPSAPWSLQGYAIQTAQPIDVALARSVIPSELEVVSILPGKTVGGMYLSFYEPSSTLEYHELIVVSGIVRHEGKLGAWISHIYVDNPDSVAGGRNIWGLPKQLARFQWQHGDSPSVQVFQDEQLLCSVGYKWQIPGMQQRLPLAGFGRRGSELVWFNGSSKCHPHLLLNANVQVPADSPFAQFGLHHPLLCLYLRQLDLTINEPISIATPVTSGY